jgi:hypothetical protein
MTFDSAPTPNPSPPLASLAGGGERIVPGAPYVQASFVSAPRRAGRGRHTAAVVTPPSTTIVCPVMKLEASEPR